jgi:hypothetical protein
MRRRRESVSAPEQLVRFVPDEWADDVTEAFDLWRRARLEYVRLHPDGGLGGPLHVIRQHAEVRRRL